MDVQTHSRIKWKYVKIKESKHSQNSRLEFSLWKLAFKKVSKCLETKMGNQMSFESSDIKMLERFQCELQWVRTILKKKLND